MRNSIKILGVEIDNVTLEESAMITKKLIENSNKSCELIVAPNTEFIMTAQKDREFYDILKTAKLATPDSVGIMLGAKVQDKKFKERIPGQAYFRKILEKGEENGWTFYLLGGKQDVVQKAKENVERLYPNVKIVGYHHGYLNETLEKEVIEEINSLQPNVLFVAMGAPRQEKWIYEHRNELKVDVATGQGGTFDYEAGRIRRAPKVIQKLGLEWLWRLVRQPTRIKRMIVLPLYTLTVFFKRDKTTGKFDTQKTSKKKQKQNS